MSNQGHIKWKVFKEIIETEINVKLIIKTVVTKILFENTLFTSMLNNAIFDLTKPLNHRTLNNFLKFGSRYSHGF